MAFISNQPQIYKFLSKISKFCISSKQNQSIMPAFTKSKIIVILFAFGGVFLSLKTKLSTKKSFLILLYLLKAFVQNRN
jgi:hypothetical protein